MQYLLVIHWGFLYLLIFVFCSFFSMMGSLLYNLYNDADTQQRIVRCVFCLHIWFCFPVLPVQLLQFVAWIVQSLIFIPFVFLCSGANFYGCFHGQTSDPKICHWVTFLLSFWLFFVIDFCCFRIWKHCKFYEREWFLCDKYYNVYECVLCFIDECSSIDSVCPLMRCHCFDSLCQWDVFLKGELMCFGFK